MRVYKVSIKSQFKHLWSLIFIIVIFPFIGYQFGLYKMDSPDEKSIVEVLLFVISVLTIPLITLHINHLLNSVNICVEVNFVEGVIRYTNPEGITEFRKEDVDFVINVKSIPLAENRLPILPWDVYNYALIKLKSGREIKISSLLIDQFDKQIGIGKISVKKSFYPWIE
ncbi:MAG: hypothetical protein R8G66_17865 [Cytophagales bacterium]|nr:hypothetical protein [Cytophagales bacterium]